MRYTLKPLTQYPAFASEVRENQNFLWIDDLNWFLALAEFQRLTQNKKYLFFLLEVWCDQQRLLALPLKTDTDGHNWSTLTNFYSPKTDFMESSDEHSASKWQLLFNALTLLHPTWIRLLISPVYEEQCQDIIQNNRRWFFNKYTLSSNWQASSKSVDEYWKQRPSQLKNTIKRKKNKLLKHDCRIEVHHHLTSELLQQYWQVYQKSWKQPESDPYFINWLTHYSASVGLLRIGIVYFKDQPIACQLWLVEHKNASIFKLAQDQAFDSLSPGTVLMAEMVDYVILKDQVYNIDFLTGNDSYKSMWMDKMTPVYGVELFHLKHFTGRLFCYWQKFKIAAKFILNRLNLV